MKVNIIGAGGGGSWLVPAMAMLVGKDNVMVMDGDTLEHKNLNRQLFTEADIGKNKARALGEKYGCEFVEGWYSYCCLPHHSSDWIIGCVDNMPGRLAILNSCDEYHCKAIIGGNERTSADSYFYQPKWKDTKLDPRVYFPEILTETDGDPTRPEGCTGEAQVQTPQLVSANFAAAALQQWLYVLWAMEAHKLDREDCITQLTIQEKMTTIFW